MSSEQSGAIILILIIFYILDLDKEIENYFTPSYIYNRCNELLKQHPHGERIKNIMNDRKKHSGKNGVKTIEEESRLRQWLNMHTDKKRIFWFVKRDGEFKLKTEYIESLNNLLKTYKT